MNAAAHAVTAEGFRTRIESRAHVWAADEPADAGGADTAPTPVELLLGALASCTTITVQMYARRKGYALKAVSARAARTDVTAPGPLSKVTLTLGLEGDLADDERARLREIAGRCPVHRTLAAGCAIEII